MTCEFNGPPITYLQPTIYYLTKPFKGVEVLYAEPLIDMSEFEKYSNNYDYCKNQFMASFSHFTHIASGGLFMVSDVQGSGCLLTDPAILSEDTKLFREKTNLGTKGIDAFYASEINHPTCNQLCEKLGLNENRADKNTKVVCVEDSVFNFDDNEKVPFICDLCQ